MKKILLFLLLLPTLCNAQLPFNTQITNWRSFNNSNVTSKTAAHSITPLNVGGGIGDSLGKYLIALKDSAYGLISAAGNLDAVLTVGNNVFMKQIEVSVSTDSCIMTGTGIFNYLYGGSSPLSFIGSNSGLAQMYLKSQTTSGYGFLKAIGLTGNRSILFPDEGTGSGLASTLMLHTTKDPLDIVVGVNDVQITPLQLQGSISGVQQFSLQMIAGIPTLTLKDASSAFGSIIHSGGLSASRSFKTPDRNGDFQLSGDQVNPTYSLGTGAGTAATLSFSGTSDDRSGTITVVAGTTPAAGGTIATITFHQAYATVTRVLLQCFDFTAGTMINFYTEGEYTDHFIINDDVVTLINAHHYIITYHVQN